MAGDTLRSLGRSSWTSSPFTQGAGSVERKAMKAKYSYDPKILESVCQILKTTPDVFTFKSNVYQTKLKRILLSELTERSKDGRHRYINELEEPLFVPANAKELKMMERLRNFGSSAQRNETVSHVTDYKPLYAALFGSDLLKDVDQLLTVLVNKILFLLLLQTGTCYIRAQARAQILDYVLFTIWPTEDLFREMVKPHTVPVVETRIRHFRDSVARYLRPKNPERKRKCPREYGSSSPDVGTEVAASSSCSTEDSIPQQVEELYAQPVSDPPAVEEPLIADDQAGPQYDYAGHLFADEIDADSLMQHYILPPDPNSPPDFTTFQEDPFDVQCQSLFSSHFGQLQLR
eukprot:Blabericola_migrator_1__4223@NODE_2297_length_2985_cov_116_805003_g1440_i0_p1_GENE_NODE_2297_length_2985_cov_116_805003_g1440_i0NODE_2297_length_2985_cov_116_805003_g1440_i0_p1_ORF_typecomplete_len347_score47_91_NODE_2297_length_2985_cov_116_805003_g1440_i09912031